MTTLFPELIETLSGIGFSENEARVYLAALELGPSAIWDIAKKSGVKRPTCYVILDELTFRGYASKQTGNRSALYSVISPTQLLKRVQVRQERLATHMRELQGLASTSANKPTVRLLEGIEGVKQAYRATLDVPKGSEILIYGTIDVLQHLSDFIPEYINTRVHAKLRARAILPDTSENRGVVAQDNTELRSTRFLPANEFNPTLEINIIGSLVIYIAHSEREPFATIVESDAIATVQRQIFEQSWRYATI